MNNYEIKKLQAQINKLKQEKEQLRLFLHEMIEAYYRTINQTFQLPKGTEESHE
jgi:septal ring factor EnvC (AmiA/AmiB activator)